MSTHVSQREAVTVNVAERSVTYIANTMFQVLFRIVAGRGLSPQHMSENRESLENGLFTWLAEQTLLRAFLEVFIASSDEAIERWDFDFTYTSDPRQGTRQPPVDEINRLCGTLRALPAGTQYRIVVQTAPGATRVPGWEPTNLRHLDETRSASVEAWGHGPLSASLTYRQGRA
jgi:hypothetical protein